MIAVGDMCYGEVGYGKECVMMIFVRARMASQLSVVYFWGRMEEIVTLNIFFDFISYSLRYFAVFLSKPSLREAQHNFTSAQMLSYMVNFIVNSLRLELALH